MQSTPIEGGRDALCEGRDPPTPAIGRLEAILMRRSHRWNHAQSEHSSQRMELHHRIDTMGHDMGHVQESVKDFMDIVAGTKFPKDVRRQLKKVQATLQSDVEAFGAQGQFVISLMADLRDSDMKLDEAGQAFQEVTEAVLQKLHQAMSADGDVTSVVSIASTPVAEHDEPELATEQIPEQLQKYYDSAVQVRFMQERLDDLYTEKAEQLTRRDLIREQDGKLDDTDEEFERTWDEDLLPARHNLDVALADLKAALTACRDADIDLPAWNPEVDPSFTRSSSPALHDKAQFSALATKPVIAGSGSSFATSSNDPLQAKQTIERWVVGVEPSLDALPTSTVLHREHKSHSLSPFGTKPPSEPGGVVSDYWKVRAVRSTKSVPCLEHQSLLLGNEEQDLSTKMPPTPSRQTSTSNLADPELGSAPFPPKMQLVSVEQALEQASGNASTSVTGGAPKVLIKDLTTRTTTARSKDLEMFSAIDSEHECTASLVPELTEQIADAGMRALMRSLARRLANRSRTEFRKQDSPSSFFTRGKVSHLYVDIVCPLIRLFRFSPPCRRDQEPVIRCLGQLPKASPPQLLTNMPRA